MKNEKVLTVNLEIGQGNVWEVRPGKWSWAHSDGSQGCDLASCQEAIQALESVGQIETQDWISGPANPSFEQNGYCWESWMSFGGISCNVAFDYGFDHGNDEKPVCPYRHPALIQAFKSGVNEFRLDC